MGEEYSNHSQTFRCVLLLSFSQAPGSLYKQQKSRLC